MTAERRVVVDLTKVEKLFIELAELKDIVRDVAAYGVEQHDGGVRIAWDTWRQAQAWVAAQEPTP